MLAAGEQVQAEPNLVILLVLVEQEEGELAHQEHLPIRMVHLEQQTLVVAVAAQVVTVLSPLMAVLAALVLLSSNSTDNRKRKWQKNYQEQQL
jgi:hypothetical protein